MKSARYLQCLDAGHWPAKCAPDCLGDLQNAVFTSCITSRVMASGSKRVGAGNLTGSGFAKTAAVVSVKIPLTADRLFAVHQDGVFA
jgi:hypothetical protein